MIDQASKGGWRGVAALLAVGATFIGTQCGRAAPPSADHREVAYLGPGGPLRIRFFIEVDGQTATRHWTRFVEQLFNHFDADGDGSLDATEFARFAAFPLGQNPSTNGGLAEDSDAGNAASGRPKFEDADLDKNGKVSGEELRANLTKRGFGPVTVALVGPSTETQPLTEALFKHLDTDKDGKLSHSELAAADRVLATLDLNEDELISQEELLEQLTGASARAPRGAPDSADDDNSDQTQPRGDFLLIPEGLSPTAIGKLIVARFGKNKSNGLTLAGAPFDPRRVAALDLDKNGILDAAEIAGWLQGRPDLEFHVGLVATRGGLAEQFFWQLSGARSPAVVASANQNSVAAPEQVRSGGDGVARFNVPGASIEVSLEFAFAQPAPALARNFLRDQFRAVAGDRKSLERKEVRSKPELQFVAPLFDSADRNGDGKLEVQEFASFLQLVEAGASRQVVIRITDRGRGLFEILDSDGDGRLSVRELRNAWKAVSPYTAKGQQLLTREQLPHRYTIYPTLAALANANLGPVVQANPEMVSRAPGRSRPTGPAWFHKMDRNRDGDISPREWLGPLELFQKMDKDGDGLISLEEACQADKKRETPARK